MFCRQYVGMIVLRQRIMSFFDKFASLKSHYEDMKQKMISARRMKQILLLRMQQKGATNRIRTQKHICQYDFSNIDIMYSCFVFIASATHKNANESATVLLKDFIENM